MNDPIKRILQSDITNEQLDSTMKELLDSKFDFDLKQEYSQYLKDELSVKRSSENLPEAHANKSKNLKVGLIAILAILMSLLAYFLFLGNSSYESTVQNYLAENDLYHHGTVRNETPSFQDFESMGFKAINNKDFTGAIAAFENIKAYSPEVSFFMAYAKMRTGNYKEAAIRFSVIKSTLKVGDDFYQESSLYHSMCELILNPNDASKISSRLKENSWSKNEFLKILDGK